MKRISSIIEQQVPSYALEDYPIFVEFLTAYYKWLEEDGNVIGFLKQYKDNIDVDLSNDEFIVEFLEEFVEYFPKNVSISESELIKYIREFYISKGSATSMHFIFRLLFGNEVDVLYPRDKLFKSSSDEWAGDVVLKTTAVNYGKINLGIIQDAFIKIIGTVSGAIAVVDSFQKRIVKGVSYIEFELSSYTHDFNIGEQVSIYINDQVIKETTHASIVGIDFISGNQYRGYTNYRLSLYDTSVNTTLNDFDGVITNEFGGILDDFTITTGGSGYEPGDLIKIKDQYPLINPKTRKDQSVHGSGFLARVFEVDSNGEIKTIMRIYDGSNYLYTDTPTSDGVYIADIESESGSGATIEFLSNKWSDGNPFDIQLLDGGLLTSTMFTNDVVIRVTDVYNPDEYYEWDINNSTENQVNLKFGCVFEKPKKSQTYSNFPSSYMNVLDSNYYQQFSYVLRSETPPNNWVGFIKKSSHPCGSKLFSDWEYTNEVSVLVESTPYNTNISSILLLESSTGVIDFNLESFDAIIERDITPIIENSILSTRLTDLDRFKFLSPYPISDYYQYSFNDIYATDISLRTVESTQITITP
jgi:hypothetical protein